LLEYLKALISGFFQALYPNYPVFDNDSINQIKRTIAYNSTKAFFVGRCLKARFSATTSEISFTIIVLLELKVFLQSGQAVTSRSG
jgi:hypothetical protein